MRPALAVILLGVALVAVPSMQSRESGRTSDSLERPFAGGGDIRMNLSAREYRVTGTNANNVRLQWTVRDPAQLWRVKARADVRGSRATIETDGPNHGGMRTDIQVPSRSNLDIRLSAGEILVEGVEGNKDIDLYAGEVNVDVGRSTDYRRVDASVWAGEIDAPAFSASKEGLFRSVDWNGTGKYLLRISLWAGEVRLYSTSTSAR
jgi:hypothetical protein